MHDWANRKAMKVTLGSPMKVAKKGYAEASMDSTKCFSVIFRGGKTLDLMTTDQDDRDEILDALDRLLHAYQQAKNELEMMCSCFVTSGQTWIETKPI